LAARRVAVLALFLASAAPLQAQPNINGWTNTAAGKWENATNWVLGTPPSTNDIDDNIFTGTTVTIDATTSGSFPDTMTVNHVAVAASSVTLALDNAGTNVPLHLLQGLDITSGGRVVITNSALQADGSTAVGILYTLGSLQLDSGWARFDSVTLGDYGTGDWYLNGGTLTVLGTMTFGKSPGGGGSVQMYGGRLIHTNNPMVLGGQGFGGFGMYGGFVQALGFQLGNSNGSQGILSVSGGTVLVSSNILAGNNIVTNPCSVTVSTNSFYGTVGTLIVTNAAGTAYIDVGHNGSLTLNGGVLQVDSLILTNGGAFTNLAGAFTLIPPLKVDNGSSAVLSSGTNNFANGVSIGSTTSSTGIVAVANCVVNVSSNLSLGAGTGSSGTLTISNNASVSVTNGTVLIGPVGGGRVSVSSGSSLVAGTVKLGGTGGAGSGELDVLAGGLVRVFSNIVANFIVVCGGDLDSSGGTVIIGENHDAAIQVCSGGSIEAGSMFIGYSPGSTGTYTQSGGTVVVTTNVVVGDCAGGALGAPTVSGGTFYITNAYHNAVLDVRNGTFLLNAGGALVVDILILTNGCGHFENNGGTLTAGAIQLDPNLDADGDGASNGAEAAAGTDPLDPSSNFRIFSIVRTNTTDIRVDWTTEGGHSYVVQTNGAVGRGSFNNLSPVISVGGMGAGTTNYVHTGGARTNAGFYRVRLSQ
jgi:hypothetical protein